MLISKVENGQEQLIDMYFVKLGHISILYLTTNMVAIKKRHLSCRRHLDGVVLTSTISFSGINAMGGLI
jgi:hypothetical protein